jgi:hypothetical protein
MSKILQVIGKLRGRSAEELRVRAAQKLHVMAERGGWSSLTRVPADAELFKLLDPTQLESSAVSADALLQRFRTRKTPRFFAGFHDKKATIAELQSRFSFARVIESARRISAGRFDLLGFHDLSFGELVNWHLEPLSGVVAPREHWSRINYLDVRRAGDKKVIWELNRHQYFTTLGEAYWLTGDERFAQTFVAHLNSWMDQNPPKVGINWASSLEIAFRSISWLWAFYFFRDSAAVTSRVFARALKFLYLNARHLETYLSTYFSPNTHLTGEALGLFYLGMLLPEFQDAARWRSTGQQILLRELDRHVRPDGVYFEQSSYYHRYTTDFYTHLFILLRRNNEPVESRLEEKLQGLLDHLMYITRPDGTTPLFGDDDGGRLLMVDRRASNDFRSALSTGATLFGRPDYKFVAGEAAEETLWLLGPTELEKFDSIQPGEPAKQSIAFTDGGYYVMRDGWTPNANYLLFDCGPHGALHCGHAHADSLSFELAANGLTLLVDPGTYTYTGSKAMRDWFRSSVAHNTLTVDGESSSVPDGPFSWKSIARAEATSWISRERFNYVEGKHSGYLRLTAPVSHRRSILFLKNDYWIMRDSITSSAEHLYALWFHLNSGVNGRVDSENSLVIGEASKEVGLPPQRAWPAGYPGLKICAFAPDGHWGWDEASVSHCYGEREPASVCVFSANAANEEFVTFLLPLASLLPAGAKLSQVRVSEIESIGGRAFEVISETAVDLVMIRDGQRVETTRMGSDFDWTWARFSSAGASIPEELVLIGGQTLELEGHEILKSRSRLSYLAASRKGDSEFRISDYGFRNGEPKAEIEIRNPKFAIRNS